MKHNLLKSVIISVILLMGVSNAWSADWHLQNNASKIYFSDLTTNWVPTYANSHHIIFLMGRDNNYGQQNPGSQAYDMKYLSNTRLWYYNVPKWGDGDNGRYQYIAFRYATEAWTDWKGETVTYRAKWNNSKYSMTRNDNISGKTLYYEPVSSATNTNTNVTGDLPKYTATVDFKVSRNGGSSYNVTNKKFGTITLKGTYMNGDAATGQSSETITGENNYNYNNIPVTGEFTLTNTALTNEAYEFVGFGTGDTPTDKVNTKTWNITGNTTYYVFYKHKLYTVTYSKGTYGSGSNQTANKLHGETLALADKGAFTRTGYTQTAWNTNTDGKSGTSYALKANYTSNQAITLYPTWTANQSTITWDANGGSVTPASSTYTYDGEPITLPTPARAGYSFNGWFTASSGGTKISDIGKTNKPTSNKTYYAQWTENKYTVNIVANPAEAAKTLTSGPKQVGINAVNIATTTNIGYQFKNWTATDGITITNPNSASTTIKATKAGTVTANFEAKPATTIYLEPTGHWNPAKAVFQAHVWQTGKTGVNLDMVGIGDPSHADGDNKSPYRYYKVEVPYGYDKILFFREDPANKTTIWNQTGDLTIPTNNQTLYVITDNTTSPATGTWKAANLVYTITLGYCEFGTYGIKYNGQSYFSKKPNDNVTIDVPAGAQIEILEGQPFSNAYTGDVIKSKPTELTIGQTLTVNGDIMLDDNFVTKESHVVYLGVPDGLTDWTSGTYGNFLWSWNTMSSFSLIASTRNFKIGNTTYYEYTIPAGRHSLCFQRKTGVNDTGTPQKESVYLPFQIPLNEVNCFTLQDKKDGTRYKGTWGTLPAREGDYRLLYIEQKVELKNGHPETTVTKEHPSDIIRKNDTRTIYSLHIYNKVENGENGMNDPEILVQQWDGSNWITTERHMVFGPLHADFTMAAMPGRRNADGDPDAVLRYDDGIENIKKDINTDDPRFVDDQASGVWNFIVTRDANNNNDFTGLDLKETKRYTGEYYVRTDCADGGWDRYTLNGNHMTRSDISKRNSNYSHYYCKWIDQEGTNVTYIIANDYGMAISDTLIADETDIWGTPIADAQKIVTGETLPTNNEYGGANIRFSWNEKSNFLHRAYLAGSTDVSSRFLVLEGQSGQLYDAKGQALTQGANGSDRYGLKANEEIFTDISNWVYYADVQLVPNAGLKLTAKYMDKVQYFIGQADIYSNTILQGTDCTQKYLIRLLYDFKINELVSAYVPGGNNDIEAIQTNLMLIRKGNNEASQLNFNNNNMKEEGQTAYGVIEFPYELLNDGSKDIYQRSLYWISFPFDVNLQDAFGVGQYGVHWLIQEYDGAARAAKGLWAESDSFWKLHWDQNITLKAGFGYVIELDISKICTDFEATFNKTGDCIAIYFPSAQPISGDIVKYPENSDVSITIPAHQCTIPIRDTPHGNRQIRDSHWNVIGVPSYVNAGADFSHSVYTRPEERKLKFYYKWITYDNYVVADANNDNTYNDNFQSMFAYMVQYEGNLTWKSVVNEKTPQGLAARQNSDTQKEHNLRLELQQNGAELDRTFITLQEDDVTAAFDFNYDLCKVNNGGANIYSLIATDTYPIQVAGNVLPVENNVIPVGVIIRTAGEYTFAMPDGTDGIMVELIDYEANTTTNLLFNDYTVSLPKGTFENRFALSVKPDKTATSLENIFNKATGDEVKKYIIDGVLYMQKDGVLYDAQGHIVR